MAQRLHEESILPAPLVTTIRLWVQDHRGSELSGASWERRVYKEEYRGAVTSCLPKFGPCGSVCGGGAVEVN